MRGRRLTASAEFCPCNACLLGQYSRCALQSEHGKKNQYRVPRVGAPTKPQMVALAEWAALLRAGMIVVFTAAAVDVHMEGV